jgi:sarcosine oxidase
VLEQGGWDYELLDGAEVAHRHPGVRLQPGEAALYEPGASVLHVDQAMRALHEQAAASGAELRTGCGLLGWQSLPGGVRARTTSGDIDAAALVLAVGHEAPALLGSAWPLEVERQVLATFELPRSLRHLPALFAVDPELGERSGFYGCPEGPDHGEYKVALHHGGLTGPPDTLPRQVLPEDWKQILEVVRRRVPALADAPVDAQACTYTNTPDHDWLLDVHPDDARVVVGTGDSGRGFRYAPAVGELLADLAQGRSADHPAFLRKERPRVA